MRIFNPPKIPVPLSSLKRLLEYAPVRHPVLSCQIRHIFKLRLGMAYAESLCSLDPHFSPAGLDPFCHWGEEILAASMGCSATRMEKSMGAEKTVKALP